MARGPRNHIASAMAFFQSIRIRSIIQTLVAFAVVYVLILISIPTLDDFKHTWISDFEETAKIFGDAYHSSEVFGLDYAQMEKKFRIYAYPDGDDYQTISGKYASEGYFFRNIRESSFLTQNPHHAHLFFIPLSCHKMHQKIDYRNLNYELEDISSASTNPFQISSYGEMASRVGEYVDGLIHRYPYWNRTLGSDHFFLTCHDIDVGATERVPLLVKNSIRVVCSPSYDSGFIPHKDVSLPLILQPFTLRAATENDINNRTILGYWAGTVNSEIRNTMVNLWRDDVELDIQKTAGYNGRMKKLYTSKFCICPAGARVTSSRITMSIRYGCVPVILADYYDLPFNDVLDWRKFSVILNENDVNRLKDILKAKAGEEWRMLSRNLLQVQKHFMWNTPPVKYDAFHMVLYDLWLRRNTVK